MGCCDGDEEFDGGGDPLLAVPSETENSSAATATATAVTVISPMNSNFVALSSIDLVRAIFELLPPPDLARAACVCRLWWSVASDREILERAFTAPWGIRRVAGSPSSSAFWRQTGLGRFAISHRVCRGDSVASLALKYSVQVMDIMRLNNMMSEHGIYSRDRVLIPIGNPEILRGSTCYIELDVHSKREVAVLYLEGYPRGKVNYLDSRSISDAGRKKILDSVKRSLGIDDATVEYYMSISNSDPRMAMMEFSQDLRWEEKWEGQ